MSSTSPHLPQYTSAESRVETYHNWPVSGLSAKELAQSGFVYQGVEDKTVCFQCGIPLKEWRCHDDPDIEHARFSPGCLYLREKKGVGFIRSVLELHELPVPAWITEHERAAKERAEAAVARPEWNQQQYQRQQQQPLRQPVVHLTPQPRPRPQQRPTGNFGPAEPRQIRARLDTEWGKRLLEQGFPRELVGQVFGERLQMYGDDFPTFRELLQAVCSAADVLNIPLPFGSSQSQQGPPPAENPHLQWEQRNGSGPPLEKNFDTSSGLNQGANYNPGPASRGESSGERDARELNRDLKLKLYCRKCLTKEANILFLCCNRRVCCEECAFDVTSCLFCGAPKQDRIKVFAA